MHDVFISYTSKDFGEAKMVCDNLENLSYIPCWMAPRDIPIGNDYADLIPDAIRQARFYLIIISKNSVLSEHVRKELEQAVKHKCVIICYRLDNTPLRGAFDYHLSSSQWVTAENRQTDAIREVADYIYEKIKELPERDAPERKQAAKTPEEAKQMLFRIFLSVIVIICMFLMDRTFYSQYAATGGYAGRAIILYLISIALLIMIMAPFFGGKRNILLRLIDVFREIVLAKDDTENET